MRNFELFKKTLTEKGYKILQGEDKGRIFAFNVHEGDGYMVETSAHDVSFGQVHHIKYPKPSDLGNDVLVEMARDFDGSVRDFILDFILKSDKDKDEQGFLHYDTLYYVRTPEEFKCGFNIPTDEFDYLDKIGIDGEPLISMEELNKEKFLLGNIQQDFHDRTLKLLVESVRACVSKYGRKAIYFDGYDNRAILHWDNEKGECIDAALIMIVYAEGGFISGTFKCLNGKEINAIIYDKSSICKDIDIDLLALAKDILSQIDGKRYEPMDDEEEIDNDDVDILENPTTEEAKKAMDWVKEQVLLEKETGHPCEDATELINVAFEDGVRLTDEAVDYWIEMHS